MRYQNTNFSTRIPSSFYLKFHIFLKPDALSALKWLEICSHKVHFQIEYLYREFFMCDVWIIKILQSKYGEYLKSWRNAPKDILN